MFILCVFFISFAFQSNARELNIKEKTVLLNLDKTMSVKNYMEHHINVQDLALSDYLKLKVLKNSCNPLFTKVNKIENAPEDHKDQSSKLSTLLNICSQGVIGITNLFVGQQN